MKNNVAMLHCGVHHGGRVKLGARERFLKFKAAKAAEQHDEQHVRMLLLR